MNWRRLRIPLLLLVLGCLYLAAQQSGILQDADPRALRLKVEQWGVYGVLLYLLLFSVGLLLYLPGTLFIVTAGLAYGTTWGIPIALLGANMAINTSFITVRLIGGSPFEQHSHPLIERLLKSLHARPVINIAVLRLFLSTNAGLNYILGLSAVSVTQHFLGTLIGSLIPVSLAVYFADWFMRQFY